MQSKHIKAVSMPRFAQMGDTGGMKVPFDLGSILNKDKNGDTDGTDGTDGTA